MADKTYFPILKLSKGRLILWDGPRLSESEANRLIADRRKKRPKDKFFIYREKGYYQAMTMGEPATSKPDGG